MDQEPPAAPRRIARLRAGEVSLLDGTVDGREVVVDSFRQGSPGIRYRIIDTGTDHVTRLPGHGDDLVGMLGRELVTWSDNVMGALDFPLHAIALSGDKRVVVDGQGALVAIVPTADGEPRLVYEDATRPVTPRSRPWGPGGRRSPSSSMKVSTRSMTRPSRSSSAV